MAPFSASASAPRRPPPDQARCPGEVHGQARGAEQAVGVDQRPGDELPGDEQGHGGERPDQWRSERDREHDGRPEDADQPEPRRLMDAATIPPPRPSTIASSTRMVAAMRVPNAAAWTEPTRRPSAPAIAACAAPGEPGEERECDGETGGGHGLEATGRAKRSAPTTRGVSSTRRTLTARPASARRSPLVRPDVPVPGRPPY